MATKLLLSVLVSLAACNSGSIEPSNPCLLTNAADLQVDRTTMPLTISWNADCPPSGVLAWGVFSQGPGGGAVQDTVWELSGPGNAIHPPLRYGVVPAGVQPIVAAKPLLQDSTYLVTAWFTCCNSGTATFTLGVAQLGP